MYVSEHSMDALRFMLPYLSAMPPEVDIDFKGKTNPHVSIQAKTQEQVRTIRQAFPGFVIWTKQWNRFCHWLEYTTAIEGVTIEVWAIKEAPPACQIIEEEVEEEQEVPVAYERRLVTVTRRRMVCPDA